MPAVEVRDARMRDIVGDDVAFEQLGQGFRFTEGPVWHPQEKYLLFSDMPGDHRRRWSAKDGVSTHKQPCNKSNGMTRDRQGRLLICEHATSRVVRVEPDGKETVLATHWQGKELNSPNDIIVRSDGSIYFSDPTYGRMDVFGLKRDLVLDFRGVYRIAPDGTLHLEANDFAQPNGLCFTKDERLLYVNDTTHKHIRRFEVWPDGRLAGGAVWAVTTGEGKGAPDGMKIDAAGNVYCCGPGGIHVFAPDATCLGVIPTPEQVANFCFGDDDLKSLFITASTSLYRIRTKQAGWLTY